MEKNGCNIYFQLNSEQGYLEKESLHSVGKNEGVINFLCIARRTGQAFKPREKLHTMQKKWMPNTIFLHCTSSNEFEVEKISKVPENVYNIP